MNENLRVQEGLRMKIPVIVGDLEKVRETDAQEDHLEKERVREIVPVEGEIRAMISEKKVEALDLIFTEEILDPN